MRITVVGSGDAFGSGGRLNTCFHISSQSSNFLIDCGATSLPGLKALGVDLNKISFILITHFHADHFGGIPPFILNAQFFSKRTTDLKILGPEGLQDWYNRYMEVSFPGSSNTKRKFDIDLIQLNAAQATEIDGVRVIPQRVLHGQPEGSFFGYRIESDEKVIAYTGDTEWVEALVDLGKDADLLISEAYFYEKRVPLHLDYKTLKQNLSRINPKRVLLTHMNEDMLAQVDNVPEEKANDGLVIDL